MFENPLISRLPLTCPEHKKSMLTYICIQPRCEGWPLFCQDCKNSYRYKQRHYGHELSVLELNKGVNELCSKLQRQKKAASKIYGQMLGVKGVQGLLKWQEQKQQHFNSIQNHINTIKFQIQQQISNIIFKFQQQLQHQKNKLYGQLEHYYHSYKQKFDRFAKLTEPIVAMQNKFKFYASNNSLFFKISSEMGQSKLGVWLSELKKTLSQTQKATNIPVQYSEQIKKYGQLANEIMDDLPRIRNIDYQKQMPQILATSASDVLRSLVKIKDTKQYSSLHRNNSMDIPTEHINFKHSTSLDY